MVSRYYNAVAERIISRAKAIPNVPDCALVLLNWRQHEYFGSLQEIAPNYSREIILLNKTSEPVMPELTHAIKGIEPSILIIKADNELDLEGRTHVLRRLESRLTKMTAEQTEYIMNHPV